MVTLADNTPAIRRRAGGDGARHGDGHGPIASPSGGTRMSTTRHLPNVAKGERFASVLGGAALAAYGARRRGLARSSRSSAARSFGAASPATATPTRRSA